MKNALPPDKRKQARSVFPVFKNQKIVKRAAKPITAFAFNAPIREKNAWKMVLLLTVSNVTPARTKIAKISIDKIIPFVLPAKRKMANVWPMAMPRAVRHVLNVKRKIVKI